MNEDWDWTVSEYGRCNASETFLATVLIVSRLIHSETGHVMKIQRVDAMSRMIVAQLAHKYGFEPKNVTGLLKDAQ
jgi:hypothetical protein